MNYLTARETYAHSHYDVTRLGTDLVIAVVHLPFSAYRGMTVYEVFPFPHVVLGSLGTNDGLAIVVSVY